MAKTNDISSQLDDIVSKVDRILAKEDKSWLRTKDAAEYLGISVTKLHAFKREGIIPHTKLGGSLYFRKRDIDQALESNIQEVV